LENTIGESVVSPIKASDYIHPIEDAKAQELPFGENHQLITKKDQVKSEKDQVRIKLKGPSKV
jgi:hypothetical protein